MLDNVLIEFGALAGVAAFISFVVNILKYFNIVKDGTADKWVAGFNLAGVIALYIIKIINPDISVVPVDSVLREVAGVGMFIFSYVTMLLGSKLTYVAIKGLPVVGTSNSLPD